MKLKDLIKEYGEYEITDEFKKLLKIPQEQKTAKNLEKGDKYYIVSQRGSVESYVWENDYADKRYLASGNIFLTWADAKRKLEKNKIEAELIALGGRTKFKPCNNNFHFAFDCYKDSVSIFNGHMTADNLIYFDTEEQCLKAIQSIGKDRLMKYWFNIEEE